MANYRIQDLKSVSEQVETNQKLKDSLKKYIVDFCETSNASLGKVELYVITGSELDTLDVKHTCDGLYAFDKDYKPFMLTSDIVDIHEVKSTDLANSNGYLVVCTSNSNYRLYSI